MGNRTKMESGRFGRGVLSCRTTRGQLQTQQEETDLTLQSILQVGMTTILAGGRDTFLISGKSSANEKPPHLKFLVYSSELLVYSNFPNLPFLLKKACLSFVPQTCVWFCPGLFVPDGVLFYFQINPSFVDKITDFYF